MDRAEATGFGVALAGHVALLAALSLGFASVTKMPVTNPPIEVSFVDEVGLESAAPVISREEPAAKLGEVEGPIDTTPPLPDPEPLPSPAPTPQPKAALPEPAPAPRPQPKAPRPEPAPAAKPKPTQTSKPAPAKSAEKAKPAPPTEKAQRPTGRLSGLLSGVSDRETDSRSTAPPAANISAAARSSLAAEIRRQLKPHWKAPTGADAELLRTELQISLARNGAVTDIEVLRTTGQTASNRPQVKLHQEQAVKAVRLAAPFRLPAEYYDAWKQLTTTFDKRLSQ